ncbi:hypothetical protein NA57DRAFT_51717 [Rhizodiscina lignyota]|uniref:Uncharacterized protein n=1 Tax=Rhizodiscina lignyota TaxID=1504668 RepID=A0A9P4IT69_9PEZI|nr:hypothetical protein NA57DRAFT_51717 [Rhizodiscina lignyota]
MSSPSSRAWSQKVRTSAKRHSGIVCGNRDTEHESKALSSGDQNETRVRAREEGMAFIGSRAVQLRYYIRRSGMDLTLYYKRKGPLNPGEFPFDSFTASDNYSFTGNCWHAGTSVSAVFLLNNAVEFPSHRQMAQPVLWPSLKAGAFAGTAGLLVGGTAVFWAPHSGVIAVHHVIVWSMAEKLIATRTNVLNAWNTGNLTNSDRRKASAIAGAVAGGTVGAVTRGPSNILPGIIVMSGLGYLGQTVYDKLDARNTEQVAKGPQEKLWVRMAKSKWSPMKAISDEEYEAMLQEKILKLDVEIALIDERIEEAKKDGNLQAVAKEETNRRS